MIPQSLQDSETALRRAVERRQFPLVQNLTGSYRELADEHLSSLAPGSPARAELLARVIDVLKWTRLMLNLTKAGLSDRLDRLLLAKRYSVSYAADRPKVHIDC